MIKVLAFDLVGVLVSEKADILNETEDKLERLFGPNKSDAEYLKQAKERVELTDNEIIEITKSICNKLYKVKDIELFKKIKNQYPNIKIVIATNHVSYIKEFIENNFNFDNLIISADINMIKPNIDFYEKVSEIVNVDINDILFIDDNQDNVDGAISSGMQGLKINHGDDVYERVINTII